MCTVKQELITLPEHLSSHLVFSGVVRFDGYLVSCVVFCRLLFVLLSFFFYHYIVVCPSSIYGFWLPLWYHWVHLAWAGFELTKLVVIGTDCIGSLKSNYHTITTAPCVLYVTLTPYSTLMTMTYPYLEIKITGWETCVFPPVKLRCIKEIFVFKIIVKSFLDRF
jgi:hypothetical protein